MRQALAGIKHLSADAETRRLAFVRERALHDEVSAMRQEREKGLAEGIVIGKAEGKTEGLAEGMEIGFQKALTRLVENGMDEEQARRMLGL